jgi:hypothetical protein
VDGASDIHGRGRAPAPRPTASEAALDEELEGTPGGVLPRGVTQHPNAIDGIYQTVEVELRGRVQLVKHVTDRLLAYELVREQHPLDPVLAADAQLLDGGYRDRPGAIV